MVRILLIFAGTICLFLGLIGVIIPILPTTPFLLLAAACYARSSKKFYDLLMTNRVFGAYLSNYRNGRGLPLKIKVFTIASLWITIALTMTFFVRSIWIDVLLIVVAIGVSVHIITIKTHVKGGI